MFEVPSGRRRDFQSLKTERRAIAASL